MRITSAFSSGMNEQGDSSPTRACGAPRLCGQQHELRRPYQRKRHGRAHNPAVRLMADVMDPWAARRPDTGRIDDLAERVADVAVQQGGAGGPDKKTGAFWPSPEPVPLPRTGGPRR